MREPRPSVDQHLPLRYQIGVRSKKTLITATSNAEECFKFSGGKLPATARGPSCRQHVEASAVRISAGQRRRELVVLAKTVLLSGRDGSHAVCMRTQASRHQRRSCSEPGCPTGQRAARARLVVARPGP